MSATLARAYVAFGGELTVSKHNRGYAYAEHSRECAL